MVTTYFFDTYALFEILAGNQKYLEYANGVGIVTTKLNLMELHYRLLQTHGQKIAEEAVAAFRDTTIEIDDGTIKQANLLKHKLAKRQLSYVDCIGYTLAEKLQVQFLTGDKEFKEMPGVAFVQ